MVRKRRLDLKLRQAEVAKVVGSSEQTVMNWEKGHAAPRVGRVAGVVRFLGFNPFPCGATVAQRSVNHRMARGITQKEFARQIGVDPSTLAKWERGERGPHGRLARWLEAVLHSDTAIS